MSSSPSRLPVLPAFVAAGIAVFALAAPLVPSLAAVGGALLASVVLPFLGEQPLVFLFPLFSRLDRGKLLDQRTRAAITDLLRQEPGLGIRDVAQRIEIGWGTAVHHLNLLERAGLIMSQSAGRHRRFFLPTESPARRTAVCLRGNPLNLRLASHVHQHPGTTQSETCRALGISPPLAHKYLAFLQRERLVTATRSWRTVQYFGAAELGPVLAHCQESPAAPEDPRPAGPMVSASPTYPSPSRVETEG